MNLSSEKIKILHVVGAMNAAGLETLIMNVFRNIDRHKYEFHFSVQTNDECFYDEEIIKMGGRIFRHPSPSKDIKAYKKALKETILSNGGYDVVHSHLLFFSGVVLEIADECNVPIRIAHSHNTSDSKKDSLLRKIYRKLMTKKINKHSTHMIGCSIDACEYVFGKKTVALGIAQHFPNAIETHKYKKLYKSKEFLIKELGISDDSYLVGHIGRFTPQKNHVLLIEIFYKFLKEENPNSHLILVGEGKEKVKIINSVKEYGIEKNVHFLGLREDINRILNSIDVFLFPSLYEGLGIVLIEAQAAGTSCLVSSTVPKEADLDLNLITPLDLNSPLNEWTSQLKKIKLRESIMDWSIRKKALNDKGYDIEKSVENLVKIYSGK